MECKQYPYQKKKIPLFRKLVCFDEVDLCLPIEIKTGKDNFPAIHILRSINKRSYQDIEQEIRKAKDLKDLIEKGYGLDR